MSRGIDHREIEDASARLLDEDPWRLLTPAAVYKALGHRPRCGGCLQLAANLIHTCACQRTAGCSGCPIAAITEIHVEVVETIEVDIVMIPDADVDNDRHANVFIEAAE